MNGEQIVTAAIARGIKSQVAHSHTSHLVLTHMAFVIVLHREMKTEPPTCVRTTCVVRRRAGRCSCALARRDSRGPRGEAWRCPPVGMPRVRLFNQKSHNGKRRAIWKVD